MKPYGIRTKLKYNYKDSHPKKGYINWWESETNKDISKTRERMKKRKLCRRLIGSINISSHELKNM